MYQGYRTMKEDQSFNFDQGECHHDECHHDEYNSNSEISGSYDWSLRANQSDEDRDERGPAEVDLSDIKTMLAFSRQQSLADRLFWVFGLFGVATMVIASIWAYKTAAADKEAIIGTPVPAPRVSPPDELLTNIGIKDPLTPASPSTLDDLAWPDAPPTQAPVGDWAPTESSVTQFFPTPKPVTIQLGATPVATPPITTLPTLSTTATNTRSTTTMGPVATTTTTFTTATTTSFVATEISQPTNLPTGFPTNAPTMRPTLTVITSAPVEPTLPPALTTNTTSPTKIPNTSPTDEPTLLPSVAPVTAPMQGPQAVRDTDNPTASPTPRDDSDWTSKDTSEPTYIPGKLTVEKQGLVLSEGLDVALIGHAGRRVAYSDGRLSGAPFHSLPDAGATFPDDRPENPGGWIYVSNSEVHNNQGGVGAFTFDKDGNIIDFQPILEGTSMNCGGGRTPWNTWVTCEEVEFSGQVYQVDPTGQREPQLLTLGKEGGRWESFAFDVRNKEKPHFFVTEDHRKGALRRFTPDFVDWSDPWSILHGNGVTMYLMLFPNDRDSGNSGTYRWTDNLEAAKNNARSYYPESEGIDVYENELFFVCKRIKMLYTLDLDGDTYTRHTTVHGLFDGQPDQMQRILNDSRDLIYFTEEGGVDAGIHARDHLGRFYTVFESRQFPDETTGLAFSPNGRFMYAAYQQTGLLFAIWRQDGHPFHASHLDIKYHGGA